MRLVTVETFELFTAVATVFVGFTVAAGACRGAGYMP